MLRPIASLLIVALAVTSCSGSESSSSTSAAMTAPSTSAPITPSTSVPTTTSVPSTTAPPTTVAPTTAAGTSTTTTTVTTAPTFDVDTDLLVLIDEELTLDQLACLADTVDGSDFNASSRAIAVCATPDQLRQIIRRAFEIELARNPDGVAGDIADLPPEADGEAFFQCFLDTIDLLTDDSVTTAFLNAESARELGRIIGRDLATRCLDAAFADLGVAAATAVERIASAMAAVDGMERRSSVVELEGLNVLVIGPQSNPDVAAVELAGSGGLLSIEVFVDAPPTDVDQAVLDELGRLLSIDPTDIAAALDESNVDGIRLDSALLCRLEDGNALGVRPPTFDCD